MIPSCPLGAIRRRPEHIDRRLVRFELPLGEVASGGWLIEAVRVRTGSGQQYRGRRNSLRRTSVQEIEAGHYERKQLSSPSKLFAWSHASRFDVARDLLAPYEGRTLLDYGAGDGTLLKLV